MRLDWLKLRLMALDKAVQGVDVTDEGYHHQTTLEF
jgi:hypothetical protein